MVCTGNRATSWLHSYDSIGVLVAIGGWGNDGDSDLFGTVIGAGMPHTVVYMSCCWSYFRIYGRRCRRSSGSCNNVYLLTTNNGKNAFKPSKNVEMWTPLCITSGAKIQQIYRTCFGRGVPGVPGVPVCRWASQPLISLFRFQKKWQLLSIFKERIWIIDMDIGITLHHD